ncbi:hypothetical protein ACF0H5_005452 [Mactra antiquata]
MERPSSHSKNAPYARKDGRKSFFSKMKDTMRDMLSPSWLTDRSSGGKESATREFAGGTMSDPDVPMSQPGPPRMQGVDMQSTSGSFKAQPAFLGNGQPRTADFVGLNPNQEAAQSGMIMPPFQPTMFPPPISEFTSAQLPLARLTEKSDSVMAHEDTMSQRSDGSKSTSGCSSMIPQTEVSQKDNATEKRKAPEQESASCSSPHEQPSVKRQKLQSGGSLNTTFTRRLSDTLIHRQASSTLTNRPAFNASLFDSPLRNESSILGTSFHESSFYPGKTTFGGRSSLSFRSNRKKTDLNQSLPSRLSMPVKVFMKAKPRVNANKEAVTSSTAKRILEALDKMPTPLNDAKRIPVAAPRQWSESPSFFSRSRTPSQSRSGPPIQKLNVSAQASISKNRQVSFAPVVQSKLAASEPAAFEKPSIPTREDTVVLSNEPAIGSGKMRRDKSYHRGSASVKPTLEEEDTVILPNLQTDYTLPVSSMPQFNFSTPVAQQRTKTSDTSTPVGQGSPKKPALNFTFSSPIHEDVPINKPASPQKFSGFQFSSPINVEKTSTDKSEPASNKPVSSTLSSGSSNNAPFSFAPPSSKTLSVESNFSVAPKPKPKLNGPTESPVGGFAVASELKQGSVMDILGGSGFSKPSTTSKTDSNLFGKQTTSSGAPPLSEIFKSSGWSCDICLVNNKADATKCAACQTPKPSTSSKAAPAKPESVSVAPKSDLFSKFQQPAGSWACDACLLQNKPDANKCIACQSPKPGGTKSSSLLLAGSVVPGNWICNTCLIQNKKEDTVCGACKTPKSTQAPSSSTKSTDLNKSDSLFSKFKPPSGQWECEVCLVQNKSDVSKCVACQSPKPLKAFKHPPGDWVCDTCLVNNKETDINCVACNYTRPGAQRTQTVPSIAKSYTSSQASGFSIPKSTDSGSISISSKGGFTFTASSTAETNTSGFNVNLLSKKDEKKQDSAPLTGGFKFSAPAGEPPSGSGFKLGSVSEANTGSGFKFGATTSNKTESSSDSGGFKFGTTVPSNNSSSDTTKDNNKESSSLTGGFQFGKSTVSSSNSISSSSGPSVGGFTFGQKSDNSLVKESVTTTTSVPGGFSFKSSDTVTSVQSLNTSQTPISSSVGGFNIQTLPVATVTNSVGVPSVTSAEGFQFVATKLTQSSTTAAIVQPTESKPSFGGFSFGQQQSSRTNTSNSTFDSAQKQVSPNKRGRDEDADEPSSKKASFNFGQAPSGNASSAFQFGSNNVASTSSSVFGTGQTSASSTPSAGLFVFGQQTSSTASTKASSSLFVFGQQNSKPATSVAATTSSSTFVFGAQNPISSSTTSSSTPVFGQTKNTSVTSSTTGSLFGQFGNTNSTSSAAPNFNFTATSTTQSGSQPSAFGSTPSFNFGKTDTTSAGSSSGVFNFGGQPAPATTPAFGTGSSFGSSNTSVFGQSGNAFSGNAPSTTPAFGATPPAFGSSNSSTPAAPAFGGVFGNNSQTTAQAPASNAVFQFGAKPSEPTPAAPTGFNFNSNPAGLGQPSGFNFGGQAQTPGGVNVFSATSTGAAAGDGRKIKKAVRKIRR